MSNPGGAAATTTKLGAVTWTSVHDDTGLVGTAGYTSAVDAGAIVSDGNGIHFTHTGEVLRGERISGDQKAIVKIVKVAAGSIDTGLIFKAADGSNFLMVGVFGTWGAAATFSVYKRIAGAFTQLNGVQQPALPANGPVWLVARMVSNTIRCELWSQDPRNDEHGGQTGLLASFVYTLSTGEAAVVGSGIAGSSGLRDSTVPGSPTYGYQDHIAATPSLARVGF